MNAKEFLTEIKSSHEYALISEHYGDRVAERSKVPLINHIDEGIVVIHASADSELQAEIAAKAFCLHPILQNDIHGLDLELGQCVAISGSFALSILHAVEYRSWANAFLSDKIGPDLKVNGVPNWNSPITRLMLVADKVQNYKDFVAHHSLSHARSQELFLYFKTWLFALGIKEQEYSILVKAVYEAFDD